MEPQKVERVIEEVRKYEHLYNFQCKDYIDAKKKENSWNGTCCSWRRVQSWRDKYIEFIFNIIKFYIQYIVHLYLCKAIK